MVILKSSYETKLRSSASSRKGTQELTSKAMAELAAIIGSERKTWELISAGSVRKRRKAVTSWRIVRLLHMNFVSSSQLFLILIWKFLKC
jgi:hypothetical protein